MALADPLEVHIAQTGSSRTEADESGAKEEVSLQHISREEAVDTNEACQGSVNGRLEQKRAQRKACCWRLLLKSLVLTFFAICCFLHLITMDGIHNDPPKYDDSTAVDVFDANEHGYFCLKIPSLIHLTSGVLLAFAEARVGACSDYAWTDLVMKRSLDNGQTWSQIEVVRAEGRTWSMTVVGNAAPVQVRSSGRVLLPHMLNNSENWLMHSDDDGLTWSTPIMLRNVSDPEWQYIGTGPPGSIQLASGRILIPAYHGLFRSNSGNLLTYLHTLYSDDEGVTWHRGASHPFGETNLLMNEVQAVELRNGSVLFVSRAGGTFWEIMSHLAARSDDGGETFTKPHEVTTLRQPFDGCEGSVARGPDGTILWVTPSPRNLMRLFRRMLTVWESSDEGESWDRLVVIHPGGAGYSSLVNLGANMGLLYERDNRTELIIKPTSIVFNILNLSKKVTQ